MIRFFFLLLQILVLFSNLFVVPTIAFVIPAIGSTSTTTLTLHKNFINHKQTTTISTSSSSSSSTQLHAAIKRGDTVLVIGGTGGVGQLVSKKLIAQNFKVKVASRNIERAQETLDDDPSIEVVKLDLLTLEQNPSQLQNALQGVQGVVISVGTTAFPTIKWKGGNTPQAIDNIAVSEIAKVAGITKSIKRVCLLTSVGVDRTNEMPFLILNLFGVLDSKKVGEQAIMSNSNNGKNYEYSIVRPGRLIGGPFTNTDIAQLLQIEGGATNGLDVQSGDNGLGDCKRDACAETVLQCLTNVKCSNVDFSIVSNEESALTTNQWTTIFTNM